MNEYPLALKFNNAHVRSICPVCSEEFKPSIGYVPFVEGTWHPVCEDCSLEIDVHITAASVVLRDLFWRIDELASVLPNRLPVEQTDFTEEDQDGLQT